MSKCVDLRAEGLFRKTGSVARQRDLKELAHCGRVEELESLLVGREMPAATAQSGSSEASARIEEGADIGANGNENWIGNGNIVLFSVHDVAGALKGFLADFAQPLLSTCLAAAFLKIAGKLLFFLGPLQHKQY